MDNFFCTAKLETTSGVGRDVSPAVSKLAGSGENSLIG